MTTKALKNKAPVKKSAKVRAKTTKRNTVPAPIDFNQKVSPVDYVPITELNPTPNRTDLQWDNRPEATETPVVKADISKGKMLDTLSQQWHKRPEDERFISVDLLHDFVKNRKLKAREVIADTNAFQATGDFLTIVADGEEIPIYPSYGAWNQLCDLLPAPADYIASRPVELQQQLIASHLKDSKDQAVKLLIATNDDMPELNELRAITSATYGRVWDADVVDALQWLLKIDPDWKVPGEFNWSTYQQNPFVETTKGNTTLFASDQDMFAFLCKDQMPIEVGKNADGTTDVYFPGFFVSNSETGHKGLQISTMMLRGICANRCLWGVEGFRSISIRHSKNAEERFKIQSAATMKSLATAEYMPFVNLVAQARNKRLTKDKEETTTFLRKMGFWQYECADIIKIGEEEDHREPRTVYEISNAITAFARRLPNNSKRLQIEAKAEQVLELAA